MSTSSFLTRNDLINIIDAIFPATSEDMTDAQIEAFINSVEYNLQNQVDYIVEQGTSGIWTYRKWNSGIAECWGVASKTTAFAVWTSPIYYGTTYVGEDFPTDLFNSVPNINVSMRASGADVWVGSSSSGGLSATNTGQYYPLRVGSSGSNVTYSTFFYANGRWK